MRLGHAARQVDALGGDERGTGVCARRARPAQDAGHVRILRDRLQPNAAANREMMNVFPLPGGP